MNPADGERSPEMKRRSLINCRKAMSEKAMAINNQAVRVRVMRMSLNAKKAAAD